MNRLYHFKLALLVFFTGLLSLALEVVYIRMLSLVLGNTTYAVSVILASFLTGLAVGNLWAARRVAADQQKGLAGSPGFSLVLLLVLAALLNVAAYYLSFLLPILYFYLHQRFLQNIFLFFIVQVFLCYLVVLPPTVVMGALYPVCFSRLEAGGAQGVVAYGNLFFVSTIGSIAGCISAGFVLIPLLGIKYSVFTVSAGYLLLAGLFMDRRSLDPLRGGVTVLLILLLIPAAFSREIPFECFNFHMMGRVRTLSELKAKLGNSQPLYYTEDVEGTVKVLEDQHMKTLSLSVAGKIEGSNDTDMPNQAFLALLPALFTKGRTRALNIGLGTGSTLRFLSEVDPPFRQIDSVEINRSVLLVMEKYFYPQLVHHSGITHHVNDARSFLQLHEFSYDLITSEPSYPMDSGVSFLFTGEFFDLVKSRLAPGGVFCQWLPGYLLDPQTKRIFTDTLCSRFPAVYLYDVFCSNDLLFICLPDERMIDGAAILQQIQGEKIHPLAVVEKLIRFDRRLHPSGGTRLNLDDLPYLEFATIRNALQRTRGILAGANR